MRAVQRPARRPPNSTPVDDKSPRQCSTHFFATHTWKGKEIAAQSILRHNTKNYYSGHPRQQLTEGHAAQHQPQAKQHPLHAQPTAAETKFAKIRKCKAGN
eukprot:GHVT01073811.1.p3 GENE.GHVT01073811.1~~GHVT01073811.1.p3  ORF type:complete len:101 (+),score=19.84 GHVT01073811.1:1418-1720(+)